MKKTIIWIVVIVVVIIVGSIIYVQMAPGSSADNTQGNSATAANTVDMSSMGSPIADVTYACDNSHSIHAVFYAGPTSTTPVVAGQPPVPTGMVTVSLDGGSPVMLAQTVSADGARYSDGNPQIKQGEPGAETFVFWNKGNSALIMRDNAMDMTYTNCSTTPAQQ